MSQSDSNPPFKSSLPELKLPEHGFNSSIPEHLLKDCDPQTAWLLREISRNTAATEFACKAVVDTNAHLRALNGKTFKNEKNLAEVTQQVDSLNEKAQAIAPLIKPVSMFASLWEYRAFRWLCYIGVFFFFTYLLPYYLAHPFSLTTFFEKFFG